MAKPHNGSHRLCSCRSRTLACSASSLLLCLAVAAHAQIAQPPGPTTAPATPAAYIREHYTKFEYKIPMRDGVRLFTAVYVPKDDSRPYPILLTRTPYSVKPYGEDVVSAPSGPMNYYAAEKFIFALQDVRGRNGSEGTWVELRPILNDKGPKDADESTDAYDTIDWLVKNIPNNNGKVGMMGISYPGFYAASGMIDSHPALKCVSPQAPIADSFFGDDVYHNGAFYLPHNFGFYVTFGQILDDPLHETVKKFDYKTPDGYEFYLNLGPIGNTDKMYFKGKVPAWTEIMDHPNYDQYWQSRNLRPHLNNIKAAVMTVGGWYDAEDLSGTLGVYRETGRRNPDIFNILVMGPWSHGQWSSPSADHLGDVNFDANTSQYYRDHIELPFLKHFLKEDGKNGNSALAKATVFETGTNQWRRYDAWPPKNSQEKALYFHANGRLSFDPPAGDEGANAFDEYLSDPAKPVPYIGYTAINMTREHMVDDQRFAAARPDVLVYKTEPLEQDITFAGPVSAHLRVSTSGTDSDFVVKLIDVYSNDFPNPDPNPANIQMGGYQQLVRGEPMRGKFRNSYEKPEPFVPGEISQLNWTMPDINHTFRRGHRIMIQVQSSWFPNVDRNPQKFCDIWKAAPQDFQKATERVYHSPDAASQVHVDVLPPRVANP
jgi:hypothetical protein